jgi:hypothetical protein
VIPVMSARFTGFLFLWVNARRHTSGIPSWAVSLLVVPQRQGAVRFIVDVGRKPDVERRPCSSGTAREHLQQTVPDIAIGNQNGSRTWRCDRASNQRSHYTVPRAIPSSRAGIRMLVWPGAFVGPCSFYHA